MKIKSKIKKELGEIASDGVKLIYPDKPKVSVSMLTCGISAGARKVFNAIKSYLETTNKNNNVILTQTGCFGFCQKEPIITVYIPKFPLLVYCEITPEKSVEIIDSLVKGEIRKEKLLCKVSLPYA